MARPEPDPTPADVDTAEHDTLAAATESNDEAPESPAPTPQPEDLNASTGNVEGAIREETAERLDDGVPPRPDPPEGEPSHDDGGQLREWLAEHDRPVLERYDAERVEAPEVGVVADTEAGEGTGQ